MMTKIGFFGCAIVTVVWSLPQPNTRIAISGTVTYRGSVPDAEIIDMGADAYCAGVQNTALNTTQPVTTGSANGLQGVVVYVKEGLSGSDGGATLEPALLDQQNCMYNPSLLVVRTSQPIVVRNSDATLHNVHVYATENRGFNIGQPFQGVESRRTFDAPEVGIQVKCDVHGWMAGSIAVFDHGYFGLTNDNGGFTLDDLPPGDYVIEAWHPTLGTQSQSVTITAGTIPALLFEFTS